MNAPNFKQLWRDIRTERDIRAYIAERRQAWLDRPLNEAEAEIAGDLVTDLRNRADEAAVADVHDHYADEAGMREFAELLRAVAEEDFAAARAALDKALGVIAKRRYEERADYADFDCRR